MEIMITPDEGVAMVFDKALDGDEFGLGETMIRGEGDRLEPELGLEIVAGDVDVGRFRALAGVEVEAVRADTEDGGHGSWGKEVGEKAEDALAERGEGVVDFATPVALADQAGEGQPAGVFADGGERGARMVADALQRQGGIALKDQEDDQAPVIPGPLEDLG